MAKQVKLTAERRTATGRSAVRKLKATGAVPAVIYGAKDKPEPLQVSRRDINAMLSHAAGENILVELEIAGKSRLALVQEVQHAPVGGAILHIDFHAVSMDEVIQADVPLEPIGTANGVKNMGGLLEQNLRSLAIECLPRDLPDVITRGCFRAQYRRRHSRARNSVAAGRDDAESSPISPRSRSWRRRWRKSRLPPRRKLPTDPK